MIKLEDGKYCYAIIENSKDENGYIPVLVIEDDPNPHPMLGNGHRATPWYWGQTRDIAQKTADKANVRLGISKGRAAQIISSSMRAQNRIKGRHASRF